MLVSVLALGYSQNASWNVTNVTTWVEAVNGIRSGGNTKEYAITVTGNVSVPTSAESTFGSITDIIITIQGNGTLSPSANGNLLQIGTGQTIITKDLTLRGRSGNSNSALVYITSGGAFRMEGRSTVTGHTDSNFSGVYVDGGTFIMQDNASISGNTTSDKNGGGVYVNKGTFTMKSGTISGNRASSGGGVYVNSGTFIMQGGTISGNTASTSGGGVYISEGPGAWYSGYNNPGTFILQGGTISSNTARFEGGGVLNEGKSFTMEGGTVSNNTSSQGGGVSNRGTFTMQGGTISGNTASASSTNSNSSAYAYGGGVYNYAHSVFSMQGGTISGNTAVATAEGYYISSDYRSFACAFGGGVCTYGIYQTGADATFTMQGGTISGNTASANTTSSLYAYSYGGGVCINRGNFTMQGNTSVSGNKTSGSGGGVCIIGYEHGGRSFTMQGSASVSGNTAGGSGGGVYIADGEYGNDSRNAGIFIMQGNTSISGNTSIYRGGGVYFNNGTFTKTGGSIYGDDADQNLKNTVISRLGHAVYNAKDDAWRNVSASPTMNSDSYGFWLNDGDVITFPSGFVGNWKRSNFNNTLYIGKNTIESSSSTYLWILQTISGNTYTFKRSVAANTMTITIRLNSNNLLISGDSGNGENNWNGTWIKQ